MDSLPDGTTVTSGTGHAMPREDGLGFAPNPPPHGVP